MKDRSVIRKFLTGALLLIFALSVTPKQYLHDLFADHTDTYSASLDGKASINPEPVNCGFDSLVVSSPFVDTGFEHHIFRPFSYNEFFPSYYHYSFFQTIVASSLRGPPAVG